MKKLKYKIDFLKRNFGNLICLTDVAKKENFFICDELPVNNNDIRLVNAINVNDIMTCDDVLTNELVKSVIINKLELQLNLRFINYSLIIF